MSTHEKLNQVPDDPGRRKFLGLLGPLGIGAVRIASVGLPSASWLLSSPEKPHSPEIGQKSLYLGWIEKSIESAFITLPSFDSTNKGHFPWTREAIFSNPILFSLAKKYFAYLQNNLENKKRIRLGDALSYSQNIAHRAIRKLPISDTKTSLEMEATHAGIIVFAAGFFTWFSPDDMEQLGISLEKDKSVTDYYWGDNGVGTNVFPRLFGVENPPVSDPRPSEQRVQYSGEDRAVHFATHLLLAFEYLYSRYYQLEPYVRIPRFISLFLNHSTLENEAVSLSRIAGGAHEWLTSVKSKNRSFDPKLPPTEGRYDPMVDADYKANELGAHAAVAAFKGLVRGASLAPLFRELNDNKFSRFETAPVLSSS